MRLAWQAEVSQIQDKIVLVRKSMSAIGSLIAQPLRRIWGGLLTDGNDRIGLAGSTGRRKENINAERWPHLNRALKRGTVAIPLKLTKFLHQSC